jgi:hypothetical protein
LKRSELAVPNPSQVKRSDRLTGGYLAFVAVRCTLQYVLLPFALPFLGFSGAWSTGIAAAIDVLALGLIVFNVWQLWNTSWRWRYLALSVVMVSILLIFLYQDYKFFFPG